MPPHRTGGQNCQSRRTIRQNFEAPAPRFRALQSCTSRTERANATASFKVNCPVTTWFSVAVRAPRESSCHPGRCQFERAAFIGRSLAPETSNCCLWNASASSPSFAWRGGLPVYSGIGVNLHQRDLRRVTDPNGNAGCAPRRPLHNIPPALAGSPASGKRICPAHKHHPARRIRSRADHQPKLFRRTSPRRRAHFELAAINHLRPIRRHRNFQFAVGRMIAVTSRKRRTTASITSPPAQNKAAHATATAAPNTATRLRLAA